MFWNKFFELLIDERGITVFRANEMKVIPILRQKKSIESNLSMDINSDGVSKKWYTYNSLCISKKYNKNTRKNFFQFFRRQ